MRASNTVTALSMAMKFGAERIEAKASTAEKMSETWVTHSGLEPSPRAPEANAVARFSLAERKTRTNDSKLLQTSSVSSSRLPNMAMKPKMMLSWK